MKLIVVSLLLSLSVCGCSNQPVQSSDEKIANALADMQLQKSSPNERIRNYQVNSWRYVDQYSLIIEAGFKQNYLVTLSMPCPGLMGAMSIGFTSSAGSFDKFEDIIVKAPVGRRADRCPVADIVKLEPIPKRSAE